MRHHKSAGCNRMLPILAICLVSVTLLGIAGCAGVGKNLVTDATAALAPDGIHIPKIEIPANTALADMNALIVHNGRVYTMSDSWISPENTKSILGTKLGVTKGMIDEFTMKDAKSVELAAVWGEQPVYTVKGYDENFRIMTYGLRDTVPYVYFFECLNNIHVNSGADVFGQMKMEGNIVKSLYQDHERWQNQEYDGGYSDRNYTQLGNLKLVENFMHELNAAPPFSREEVPEAILWQGAGETAPRHLRIFLKDGVKVDLTLFYGNFVAYNNVFLYFKMDSQAFTDLWNQMQEALP